MILSVITWKDQNDEEYITAENSLNHTMAMESAMHGMKSKQQSNHRLINMEFYITRGEHHDQ